MTLKEFKEIEHIIRKLKAQEYQIAYSKQDGYSIITKDYKHICFITPEEYRTIERILPSYCKIMGQNNS